MREPAEYADEIERDATLPAGSRERFRGYGVMGLPFRSGHILGLRRHGAAVPLRAHPRAQALPGLVDRPGLSLGLAPRPG